MKHHYLPMIAATLLLGTCGCCSGEKSERNCFPVISKECNGQTVKLKIGEKTTIKLAENPTTGYQWSFTNSTPQCCRVTDDKFIAPTSGLMGAPGRREVKIEAVTPGKAVFNFVYTRSWEKAQPPAEKFSVILEVTE